MAASDEFVDLLISTLKANAAVTDIVGNRVFDVRPIKRHHAYITIGSSDAEPENLDCIDADLETVQIDCWVRDDGRMNKCRGLVAAVHRAVHLKPLVLSQHAVSDVRVISSRVFADSDKITTHGVLTVSAMLETVGP